MEPAIRQLLDLSRRVLEKTQSKNSAETTRALKAAIRDLEANPDAVVQLYSVSQAGKSTLFSMLTRGEQFVPVGLGKATTAVVIELIGVDTQLEERAEVMWLPPPDVLSLVVEPLEPYLGDSPDGEEGGHGGSPAAAIASGVKAGVAGVAAGVARMLGHGDGSAHIDVSALRPESLREPAIAQAFRKALSDAYQYRRAEAGEAGSKNDLAVAEIVLRHFNRYLQHYRPGFMRVPLEDLHHWTRQPYEWGERPASEFSFDELRCFFIQRVRLYARTHDFLEGVRVIDAPGFGVSRLHDRISRKVQESADAVMLLLGASGAEINLAQLQEVQQLAVGVRGNLFVLWNPKNGTRQQAEQLLQGDLRRLLDGAGIDVPGERSTVANLLLGLRALQWQRLSGEGEALSPSTLASLADAARFKYKPGVLSPDVDGRAKFMVKHELKLSFTGYIGDPEIELGSTDPGVLAPAGLEQSGWKDDIPRLFAAVRAARTNRRVHECAARAADAIAFYLAQFPPPTESENLRRNITGLELLAEEFSRNADDTQRALEEALRENMAKLIEELPDYLLEKKALQNLYAGVRHIVDNETQSSLVHTKLRARVKDYVETRSGVWCSDVAEFRTTVSKTALRMKFESLAQELREWTRLHAEQNGVTVGVDLPEAALPKLDFDRFRTDFSSGFGALVDRVLTPDLVTRFVTWVVEKGKAVVESVVGGWKRLRAWVSGRTVNETPPRPRFDRAKAWEQIERELNQVFDRKTLQYLLVVDPAAYRSLTWGEFLSALGSAAARGSDSFAEAVGKAFEIVEAQREEQKVSGNGVIIKAVEAIVDASVQSFVKWRNVVLETLVSLRDNLVAQEKGMPSPLPDSALVEFGKSVDELENVVGRTVEVAGRLAHVREAIKARQATAIS